jgi:hypothetical protein
VKPQLSCILNRTKTKQEIFSSAGLREVHLVSLLRERAAALLQCVPVLTATQLQLFFTCRRQTIAYLLASSPHLLSLQTLPYLLLYMVCMLTLPRALPHCCCLHWSLDLKEGSQPAGETAVLRASVSCIVLATSDSISPLDAL